jgi:hypothetical protein
MIIYLDTCCYGRPSDDQDQFKIVVETAAIMAITEMCRIAGHCIVGSAFVTSEIWENPDIIKRNDTKVFFDEISNKYVTNLNEVRAQELQTKGLRKMDSYHLAVAEFAGVDVLLTTDKDFIRICAKHNLSHVKVINPLTFLPEVIK